MVVMSFRGPAESLVLVPLEDEMLRAAPQCVKTLFMIRLGSPRTEDKSLASVTYPLALSFVGGILRIFTQPGVQHHIECADCDTAFARQDVGFTRIELLNC
jgi:hypothetical protein